jgi:hypothetical protein
MSRTRRMPARRHHSSQTAAASRQVVREPGHGHRRQPSRTASPSADACVWRTRPANEIGHRWRRGGRTRGRTNNQMAGTSELWPRPSSRVTRWCVSQRCRRSPSKQLHEPTLREKEHFATNFSGVSGHEPKKDAILFWFGRPRLKCSANSRGSGPLYFLWSACRISRRLPGWPKVSLEVCRYVAIT